jgi:FtsH-binding integral membrane protein
MKKRNPLTPVGLFLIALSAYVLIYLTVTESFIGTLFPTGIAAMIIGAVGVKLIRVRMKQKKERECVASGQSVAVGNHGK